MSDGITDVARDIDLQEKSREILSLEKMFGEIPSIELAKKILNKFNEFLEMPKGYYNEINTKIIKERINHYQNYIIL